MPDATSLEAALASAARDLSRAGKRFALVDGLAVSVRAEVRFTRDIDLAITVASDKEAEALVLSLGQLGYRPVATVEHETRKRLSTARLVSPQGVKIDLLFASSGNRIDAQRLLQCNPSLDMARVRSNLKLITDRGFERGQDLVTKLEAMLPSGT